MIIACSYLISATFTIGVDEFGKPQIRMIWLRSKNSWMTYELMVNINDEYVAK